MKLIGSLTSPFVRKTRIVVAEKKIECEFVVIPPGDGFAVAHWNPLARVPTLVLDDESALFDSRVIVEYLDNLAPNNRLIPPPGRARIAVKRWEALCDGILDAAVAVVMENRRPEAERSPAWIDRNRHVIHQGVATCAAELGENNWYQGTSITLADIAVGCVLGYVDLRFPDIDWRTQHPNLGKLHDKLMQRPSFTDTTPPG